MPIQIKIISGKYFDSVSLMLAARTLRTIEGVDDAAIVMGTEQNKHILESSGFVTPEVREAKDNNVVLAVRGRDDAVCARAMSEALAALEKKRGEGGESGTRRPRTLQAAMKLQPNSNLALISLPGKHAAQAAREALETGLHVMLFSDNVSVEEEIELKKFAADRNLLVMGPDCGTAIINGIPLAFANSVRRGSVGIVAASGTGLQEVCVLLDAQGSGVSQAIGTGGRDLKKAVGGIAFLQGIEFLLQDEATRVVMLVSKPPEQEVLKKIINALAGSKKPVVSVFLGANANPLSETGIHFASTLEEGAFLAAALAQGQDVSQIVAKLRARDAENGTEARAVANTLVGSQRFLRGLFCGGTLAAEAELILGRAGLKVHSNLTTKPENALADAWESVDNTLVDLGDDVFTVGRPHPMIDDSLRNKRLLKEASDSSVAAILFDVVLGYGSNLEPLKDLLPTLKQAQSLASSAGRALILICSVTGTNADPQHRDSVVTALQKQGVRVFPSNAAAAMYAANLISARGAK